MVEVLRKVARELLQFLVRTEQVDVDAGDHLRDGLVGDRREDLLAEAEEVEVGGVAEVEELEVVLPQGAGAGQQGEVVGLDLAARSLADPPPALPTLSAYKRAAGERTSSSAHP